jgi:hypothetical protein
MDISAPLMMQQQLWPGSGSIVTEEWDRFRLMGRLLPGVTLEQA